MANRSDRNSAFPRKLKRQLALQSTGDAHRDGEIRRIMISAHARAKAFDNKRLRMAGGDDEEETANVEAQIVS